MRTLRHATTGARGDSAISNSDTASAWDATATLHAVPSVEPPAFAQAHVSGKSRPMPAVRETASFKGTTATDAGCRCVRLLPATDTIHATSSEDAAETSIEDCAAPPSSESIGLGADGAAEEEVRALRLSTAISFQAGRSCCVGVEAAAERC